MAAPTLQSSLNFISRAVSSANTTVSTSGMVNCAGQTRPNVANCGQEKLLPKMMRRLFASTANLSKGCVHFHGFN